MDKVNYPHMDRLRPDASSRVISAEDIRVLVFTCNRRSRPGIQATRKVEQGEHYIYQMLSSLFMCDPLSHRLAGVDLYIGDGDPNYLWWFYRHTKRVRFHKPVEGMNDGADTPHRRLTRNFIRVLREALTMPQPGFLICEDDVVFQDGFWSYALDAINEMRCTPLKQEWNTLTFYSTGNYIGKASYYRGCYFCSAGGPFAGLCGIYYDKGAIADLLKYLEENETRLPADLLYTAWSDKMWTRYATPTGLIQHVGGVSAGTSAGAYWTDGRFDKPMQCWHPGWVAKPYEHFPLRRDLSGQPSNIPILPA